MSGEMVTVAYLPEHVSKRRALIAESRYEHFDSTHVFERDGYICQLCGVKTKPDLKDVHNHFYPNLDHIIPLSKGGEHSVENTQCLCRVCNMIKSNKIEVAKQSFEFA